MSIDLLDYVTRRVRAHTGSYRRLADDAGVEHSWLLMFARGAIKNPGIIPIQKLANHFALLDAVRSDPPQPQDRA